MVALTRFYELIWDTDLDTNLRDSRLNLGLRFRAAHNLKEVTSAWQLVYDVYSRNGLINANPFMVHTTPQAASERTAVFHGCRDAGPESTLTAVVDGPSGLPLDCLFGRELSALRNDARRLMECCMFAHSSHADPPAPAIPPLPIQTPRRTKDVPRVAVSLVNLMRLAFWYGVNQSVTDFVLSVPPSQAHFYARAFGFRQVSTIRKHRVLNDRPLVLIHANLESSLKRRPLPFALRYCLERPIGQDAFEHRVKLRPHTLSVLAGQIDGFLRAEYPGWDVAA